MKPIALIDGHNLLFRMFYGIPAPIRNAKGEDIRALIGFVGTVKKIHKAVSPQSIAVVFDTESSADHNKSLDGDYKSNRPDFTGVPDEENPFAQLPKIKKALDYLNIHHCEVTDDEADDYIASVTHSHPDNDFLIYSTDSDFIQLVSPRVKILHIRGQTTHIIGEQEVADKYHIHPRQYTEYKALVGDSSDNVKGVRGIGPKTAAKILASGDIQTYIHCGDNSKLTVTLRSHADTIKKNKQLITLDKHLNTSNITFHPISPFLGKTVPEILQVVGEK